MSIQPRQRAAPRRYRFPRRTRRAYRYPRRMYRRFRKGKQPIPILPVMGGLVAPMATALQKSNFFADIQTDPMKATTGLIDQVFQRYTGFSPLYGYGWQMQPLIETYGGLFAGMAGHMIANKLGVNKQFRKIPVVGKYVQL